MLISCCFFAFSLQLQRCYYLKQLLIAIFKAIGKLHDLDIKIPEEKKRVLALVEGCQTRKHPKLGEKFGDEEYYYSFQQEIVDSTNRLRKSIRKEATGELASKAAALCDMDNDDDRHKPVPEPQELVTLQQDVSWLQLIMIYCIFYLPY